MLCSPASNSLLAEPVVAAAAEFGAGAAAQAAVGARQCQWGRAWLGVHLHDACTPIEVVLHHCSSLNLKRFPIWKSCSRSHGLTESNALTCGKQRKKVWLQPPTNYLLPGQHTCRKESSHCRQHMHILPGCTPAACPDAGGDTVAACGGTRLTASSISACVKPLRSRKERLASAVDPCTCTMHARSLASHLGAGQQCDKQGLIQLPSLLYA